MGGKYSFYGGTNYGLDSEYGNFMGGPYRVPAGSISLGTDARLANQVKAVSDKVNTGAKAAEVQLTMPEVAESIPDQYLDELNRLRKLTGIDLTLHGPLVEPTGVGRDGWDEESRRQAERQMWSALERAHRVDPQGNLVVTFHSSNGLPPPESKVWDPDKKEEKVDSIVIMDERTGQMGNVTPKFDYLKNKEESAIELVNKTNKDAWYKTLQGISFHANQGKDIIDSEFGEGRRSAMRGASEISEETRQKLLETYKKYLDNPQEAEKYIEKEWKDENGKKQVKEQIRGLIHGDLYLRDAYQDLQKSFNSAYFAVQNSDSPDAKKDLQKLEDFRKRMEPKLKYIEDPSKVSELAEEIEYGVQTLRSITVPQTLKPLREFAIDKASETFSNLAMNSYKTFKDTAPIISIENPPAGMGLSRADDLRDLIKESQKKFAAKAQEELGLSESEAKEQAKKLIGATWDVGHINMIRKQGYGDKELIEETKKIAPFVKNIHLSDNFGMEHTELPMGMGNVPMKEHLAALREQYGNKLDKIKQVVEASSWYQHFGGGSPFIETLESMGSPIYGMKMSPYWNQSAGMSGGYFAGLGMNPDIHHSLYGAGFSNLPPELGGQMAGRSRMGGAPMD